MVANLKHVRNPVRVPPRFAAQMLNHHWKARACAVNYKPLFIRAEMIKKVLLNVRVSRRKPVELALQTLRYLEMNDYIVDMRRYCVQYLIEICI